MILFPNAKINLGLHVLSRRVDGYHNIETMIVETGLSDILEFIEAPDGKTEIVSTGRPVPGDAGHNLIIKAWQLMYEKYHIPSVKIHLHKIIPLGSGLGGGSSDAAFMLNGLSEYFELNLTSGKLRELVSSIGSDCAFFIDHRPAIVEGRGDILTPAPNFIQDLWLYIFYPGLHVSTSEAYKNVIPDNSRQRIIDVLNNPIDDWKHLLINDFESFASRRYPLINEIKQRLYRSGAIYASMTGSGSAVYGIFRDKPEPDDELKKWIIWEEKVQA